MIYCSAVYRDKCRETSPEEFAVKARQFNKVLMDKCLETKGRKYYSLKGFWRDTETQQPMPVSWWSSDGIHPGPAVDSAGFQKYKRNIRSCLLAAAAELTAISR